MNLLKLSESEVIAYIQKREAKVTVIGLGKMGLPIAMVFANANFHVVGYDISQELVDQLNSGQTTINEPIVPERLAATIKSGHFSVTTDLQAALADTNFIVIIIPVLVDDFGHADIEILLSLYEKLSSLAPEGAIIVQETTLPPRTSEDVLKPLLAKHNRNVGQNIGLVFAPERTFSGRAIEDIEERYPKIVGGITQQCGFIVKQLYEQVCKKGVIQVSNATTAEAVKTFKGAYRDANIAIANQFAILADKMGIDILEVVEAANTEPFSHIHTPGIGVGGHCIPVYPHFVIQQGKKRNYSPTLFIESRKTNDAMVDYTIEQIEKYAPDWNRNALILGLAYRGGVKELRLSPTLRLVPKLREKVGSRLKIIDPLFSKEELDNQFGNDIGFDNTNWNEAIDNAIDWASIIIIVTDHEEFKKLNYRKLSNKIIFDGRYVIDPVLAIDFFLIQPGRELYTR